MFGNHQYFTFKPVYNLEQIFYTPKKLKNINSFIKAVIIFFLILGSIFFVQGLTNVTHQSSENLNNSNEVPTVINPSANGNEQTGKSEQPLLSSPKSQFQGFVENNGQINNPNIKYIATVNNYVIYFENNQIMFKKIFSQSNLGTNTVTLQFIGTQAVNPAGFRIDPFFFSKDSAGNKINSYQELWYYNIYPKIDLKYYMTNQGLKYEFMVKPGGNPSNILVHLDTQGTVQIQDKELTVYSSQNSKAVIYSDTGLKSFQGYDQAVYSSFKKVDSVANTYSFSIGNYNPQQILFIDPYVNLNALAIDGNGAFYNMSILYKWSGTGTASSPYLINNVNVTSRTTAISIANTTVYFIIENSVLQGYSIAGTYGIYLFNVKNGQIYNNSISYFNSGIYIVSSSSIKVTSNKIFANTNAGIYLSNSNNNNLSSNFIYNNANYGIYFQNSSNNVIDKNEVYLTGFTYVPLMMTMSTQKVNVLIGAGIVVDPSINNSVTSNIIYNNLESGFVLQYSNNSLINGNSIYNNQGNGIEFTNSNNNMIESNFVFGNGNTVVPYYYSKPNNLNVLIGAGIIVDPSKNNTLLNNEVYQNSGTGVSLLESNNMTILNNKITSNGINGLEITNSSKNFITNNNISFNGIVNGIYLENFKPSSISVLIGAGIVVDPSSNLTISYNIIRANGQNGIVIEGSSLIRIMHNVIFDHSSYGLTLDSSTTNSYISYNEFFNNNQGGVQAYDDGSNNVFIYNYWSDDSSGSPYYIAGSSGSVDLHPLTHPIIFPAYTLFAPKFTSPIDGQSISGNYNIQWSPAHDTFNHTILYSLDFKLNQVSSWTILATNLNTTNFYWNTNFLKGNYTLKLTAYFLQNTKTVLVNILINSQSTVTTQSKNVSTSIGFEFISILMLIPIIFITRRKKNK